MLIWEGGYTYQERESDRLFEKLMDGWIKLHRKSLENRFFRHDLIAWHIFTYLLLVVDRKTGRRDTGRFIIAENTGIKPNTIYAALKRLEKAKMITQVSNNRFTIITICNWHIYQGDDNNNDNNTITSGQQHDNTNNKNRELRIKNIANARKDFLSLEKNELLKVQEVWEGVDVGEEYQKATDFLLSSGRTYKNYNAFFRNWLRRAGGKSVEPSPYATTDDGKKVESEEKMKELIDSGDYLLVDDEKKPYRLIRREF